MSLPSASTIKRLFAVSGNNCAFPKCPIALVDEATGKVIGRICHIKARSPGGPRFDGDQTEEERNGFSNLLLLCPIHHDVIDADPDAYTVNRLLEMKTKHEELGPKSSESTQASNDLVDTLILLTYNEMSGDLVTSQSQSGGQTAHQITNVLLQPDVVSGFEREMQNRRYDHDVEIFQGANIILDEPTLDKGLDAVGANHSYVESFRTAIAEFVRFFGRAQNQYLDPQLHMLSKHLTMSLQQLEEFLLTHFFTDPGQRSFEDMRYCLHPEFDIAGGGSDNATNLKNYHELSDQLKKLVFEVRSNFNIYRNAARELLSI